MITQIYGITTPEDAAAVAALGVERIGVVVCEDENTTPDGNSIEQARAIMKAIPPDVTACVLTFSTAVDEIEYVVRTLEAKVLHLSAIDVLSPAEVRKLLARIPNLKIMQAIPVRGHEAIEHALAFQDIAECILLDTAFEGVKIGATGRTHDWVISRKVVEQSKIPVILAGGLSPENVGEAIRQVRPWGVDSFTLTSYPDDIRRKDLGRVRDFIQAAKQAA